MSQKSPTLGEIRNHLRQLADEEIAAHSQRFFKTGPGEYGEGDKFIGVRVPVLRKLAKQYRDIPTVRVISLLKSRIHEERLLALLILVLRYEKGDEAQRKSIFDLYVDHLDYVDNWDLVDCSAHKIVGDYLLTRNRKLLYRLAKSKVLWARRIAVMSTLAFIREHEFDVTLELAVLLLQDPEDLIHKSVGWMLREIGNRDRETEEIFLRTHYRAMPRTMLRYAIEKFPEPLRRKYIEGKV